MHAPDAENNSRKYRVFLFCDAIITRVDLQAAGYVFVKRKRSAVEEIFCMNIQAAS